jgi:hypothetical protein
MGDADHSELAGRLRLIGSLLTVARESLAPLPRLLGEVQEEIDRAVRTEERRSSQASEVGALRREVEQLREGLGSRAVIERAKGILMQAQAISEAESFDLLTGMSQARHRKLRDVAADVVAGVPVARAAEPPAGGAPPGAAPAASAGGPVRPHLVEPPRAGGVPGRGRSGS